MSRRRPPPRRQHRQEGPCRAGLGRGWPGQKSELLGPECRNTRGKRHDPRSEIQPVFEGRTEPVSADAGGETGRCRLWTCGCLGRQVKTTARRRLWTDRQCLYWTGVEAARRRLWTDWQAGGWMTRQGRRLEVETEPVLCNSRSRTRGSRHRHQSRARRQSRRKCVPTTVVERQMRGQDLVTCLGQPDGEAGQEGDGLSGHPTEARPACWSFLEVGGSEGPDGRPPSRPGRAGRRG